MEFFEGYLERIDQADGKLTLRFLVGGFNPEPDEPPALMLTISEPQDLDTVLQKLNRVMQVDEWSYVSASDHEANLGSDHGEELTIAGRSIDWQRADYNEADHKRLAKQNYDWGQSQYQALSAQSKRLSTLRELIQGQLGRVAVKAAGHEPGSTARTLYEQQLSFLERLLRESEA